MLRQKPTFYLIFFFLRQVNSFYRNLLNYIITIKVFTLGSLIKNQKRHFLGILKILKYVSKKTWKEKKKINIIKVEE